MIEQIRNLEMGFGSLLFLGENPPMKCFWTYRSSPKDPASDPNPSVWAPLLQ